MAEEASDDNNDLKGTFTSTKDNFKSQEITVTVESI